MRALLRYPGGKCRLAKRIIDKIVYLNDGELPERLIEPFAGGASVGLEYLSRGGKKLCLSDRHPGVADLWNLVTNDPDVVRDFVRLTTPTVTMFRALLDNKEEILPGLRLLLLNKCSFSGLCTVPIGGWGQKSDWKVDEYWSKDRLVKVVLDLHVLLKGTTTVSCGDFSSRIVSTEPGDFVYLDPPYVKAGNACYREATFYEKDHLRLAERLHECSAKWLLSYDNDQSVREMYKGFGMEQIMKRYFMKPGCGDGKLTRDETKELLIWKT